MKCTNCKGEIIAINTMTNDYEQRNYQIVIETQDKPKLRLGECEVKQ